jgi:GNAT superfamily N-acetyltransferase
VEPVPLEFRSELPAIDPFWNLFVSTGWNDGYRASPAELEAALQASWCVVSAVEDGRLVGFGRVLSDGILHAMIYEVIVAPSHQRRGIGKRIVDQLVQRCRDAGIRDIQLFCAPGKQPFYEQLGFIARPGEAPGMDYRPRPVDSDNPEAPV